MSQNITVRWRRSPARGRGSFSEGTVHIAPRNRERSQGRAGIECNANLVRVRGRRSWRFPASRRSLVGQSHRWALDSGAVVWRASHALEVGERAREQIVAAYEDVHGTWQRLSRDGHIGMSDAFQIVVAAANTDSGRRALAEILATTTRSPSSTRMRSLISVISRDIPLPPGVEDHRADAYFRTRFYTGTRLSKTHRVRESEASSCISTSRS